MKKIKKMAAVIILILIAFIYGHIHKTHAICSTLRIVSFENDTLYFLFRIMDTVACDTPAACAISEEVTFFFLISLLLSNAYVSGTPRSP